MTRLQAGGLAQQVFFAMGRMMLRWAVKHRTLRLQIVQS